MAYTYQKLSDVALVNSAVEPNLLIEENGDIKKISVSNIAAPQVKADWNETDATSAAFILNKPDFSQVGGGSSVVTYAMSYTVNSGVSTPSYLAHTDSTYTPVTAAEIVDTWDNDSIIRINGRDGRGQVVGVSYTLVSGAVSTATITYFAGSGSTPETLTI